MRNLCTPIALVLLGLGLAVGTGGASEARATTVLAFSQLAGVRDFQLSVVTRIKGKHGLRANVRETEALSSESIVEALQAGGLQYKDASPHHLLFVVEYSYDATKTEWVALAARLELHERAELARHSPMPNSVRELSVVSWSWSEVDLVHVVQAEKTIVTMARGLAERLVAEVKLATETFRPPQ
jgi:hypothetical protein